MTSGMSGEREELLRRRLAGARSRPDGPAAGARAGRPVLSHGQRRIWFIDRLQPGSPGYTIPIAYRLRGALHVGALHGALAAVTHRHEVLRTRFPVEGDEPYQDIAPDWPGLALDDLSGSGDPVARAREVVAEAAYSTFDLAAGPLLRAKLLRLAATDHVLLITVHHSVFDGASLSVFSGELAEAYSAIAGGGRPELGEEPVQYADFAAWQHRYLTDERVAEDLAYWRERLDGLAPVLALPTDRPRPKIASARGGAAGFTVPAATTTALRELARARSASLFLVTFTAFHAVIGRYAGTTDVVLGVPVAGRDRRELENMIGFFAQTLPVRVDCGGEPTFAALLDRVRDRFSEATAHQRLPFDRLVEHLADRRDLSHNPIVQVLFNVLGAGTGAGVPRLPGIEAAEFGAAAATTRFDLELHLVDEGDRLDGRVVFAADLFDDRTMSWFTGHFLAMLTAVAADPGVRVGRVPLITPEELALIEACNDRSVESEYA
ncbi:condensation domain-containing protein [Amycolatopsis sp. PS_44_ISF1]|uniref:condensation domain-containing protein n=1 Tax=Amycolatopsis sp. PS_44_ISF1 TaxID=2974917 RepID=UPI0028DD7DAB|nr:condensation domain-containing protein [Amycolatopsis sp. PS_44_ISF1]MDT8914691.1 condensation domain-containing protein [Amycolatopsis sp. PS_44_ISF1]